MVGCTCDVQGLVCSSLGFDVDLDAMLCTCSVLLYFIITSMFIAIRSKHAFCSLAEEQVNSCICFCLPDPA